MSYSSEQFKQPDEILMNNENTLVLDFEKNIVEIEDKIEAMRHLAEGQDVDITPEITRLQQKLERQMKASYAN